jgi:DNA repair protein RecO (recombination protein O)
MSHHIYKTHGIILRGIPDGESNKYLNVFTRELGLVGAAARSVRHAKSKLRYGLQDYSISLVSLVRGKEVWRLINAVPASSVYSDLKEKPDSLRAAARLLSLLRKLIAGEERHPELYDMAESGMQYLCTTDLSREELTAFQLVFAMRTLDFLGYAIDVPKLVHATQGNEWSKESLGNFLPFVDEARVAVEKSLQVTHLYQ